MDPGEVFFRAIVYAMIAAAVALYAYVAAIVCLVFCTTLRELEADDDGEIGFISPWRRRF